MQLKPMPPSSIIAATQKATSIFEEVTINFTGGEPLLHWDTVAQALESSAMRHKGITKTTITTNGTLLTADIAKHLKRICPDLDVDITIDGPPECHNTTRPHRNEAIDSSEMAVRGMQAAVASGLNVTLNSVITRTQLELGASPFYKYMSSLGAPWIIGKAITPEGRVKITEDEFIDFATKILECWATDEAAPPTVRNTLVDSLLLRALEHVPVSYEDRCAMSILSFAGEECLAWPCTKLVPYSEYCLGSFVADDIDRILSHPLRLKIFDLFSRSETCAHEALVETGEIQELPKIASSRIEFKRFLQEIIE